MFALSATGGMRGAFETLGAIDVSFNILVPGLLFWACVSLFASKLLGVPV